MDGGGEARVARTGRDMNVEIANASKTRAFCNFNGRSLSRHLSKHREGPEGRIQNVRAFVSFNKFSMMFEHRHQIL